MRQPGLWLGSGVLALVVGAAVAAWNQTQASSRSPAPAASTVVRASPDATSAEPVPPVAAKALPAPTQEPPPDGSKQAPPLRPPAGAIVAPGTPPEYWHSYLAGYNPSEILEDGTQVFNDVPFWVRQPDGSLKQTTSTLRIKPTPPLPIDPMDAGHAEPSGVGSAPGGVSRDH